MQNIYKMNFPMRILYRLMSGTALLALPYFSTAQVTKATDDYAQMLVNAAPITIRVLDNDSAANGRRLKVDYLPLVNHGTARITADSSAIEFTPEPDFKGIALVNYTIADSDGAHDCGLVVVDVAASPTPMSQEMNLFTRRGRPLRFTVPAGFVTTSFPQGATLEAVNGYVGVYQFSPDARLVGTFDLLFNKNDNGVTKEFRVQIEVLNAPPMSKYAVDDYPNVRINGIKLLSVLNNDNVYPYANIASVDPVTYGGDFTLARTDQTNVKNGRFTVTPGANFKGSIQFGYKVTYEDGFQETGTVHLTVSNFLPAANAFTITALARRPQQELRYKVPTDFSEYHFEAPNRNTSNGGLIEYDTQTGQLRYSAPQTNVLNDAFSVKYCIDGGCQSVDVKVNLVNLTGNDVCTSATDCIWAGDANQDGVVNIEDIFPIGDNMGQYGSKRLSLQNGWYPQSTNNWRSVTRGVADPKYADTNGDGMISVADTAAIMKHYGNANTLYPERIAEGSKIQTFLVSGATSVRNGDMIEILVLLGSSEYPAIDTRGLSFAVNYNQKVDENTLTVDFGRFNWLSRYDAFLTASKIPQKGTVDAAIVRSRDRGASGHGEVGKIRAIVIEDQAGFQDVQKPAVRISLKNVVLVGSDGRLTQVQGSELVLPLLQTKKDEPLRDSDVVSFPNPTSDFMEFHLNGYNTIHSIRLLDLRGREVKRLMNVNGKQTRLNLDDLANGLYMAEVMTDKGRVVKKVQVIK